MKNKLRNEGGSGKRGKSKMDCTKKSQEANVKCEKRVMILSCLLVLVCACVLLLLAGNRKQKEAVGWYNTIANSLCHASSILHYSAAAAAVTAL